MTCSFPGCSHEHRAHGLCNGHLIQRKRGHSLVPLKHRGPNRKPSPLELNAPPCAVHGTPKTQRLKSRAGRAVGWRCPRCHADRQRARKARRVFDITREALERMIAERGGRCDICKQVPSGKGRDSILHIDHDHVTGNFRGLLCRGCNLGIGFLRDDPERCAGATEYLRRWLGV